jgi:DNA-binding NarL/FixJ family response regulator
MKKDLITRILVADDHYVVRMGVIAIINNEPDMEVVAEAANGTQAIELFTKHKPDLVLLDSRMPLKGGVQAAQEIHQLNPSAHILMLTAFDGDEDIHKALAAGARGYVLKSSTGEQLVPAVRAAKSPPASPAVKNSSRSPRASWKCCTNWQKAWPINRSLM